MLPLVEATDEGRFRFGQLLASGDFAWLLTLLTENVGPAARAFLIDWLAAATWNGSFEVVDAVATASASYSDLAAAVRPMFDAWPIVGAQADEARAHQARLRALFAERPRRERPAPALERVKRHLDAFEGGDPSSYCAIDFELGIDDSGDDHFTILKSDTTKLPGWAALDDVTRQRIVEAAATYVRTGRCSPESWVSKSHEWNPALAGYRALRLLRKENPRAFEALPGEIWAEWAPIVGAFPSLDAQKVKEHGLFERAYANAPDRLLDAVLGLCRRQHSQIGHIYAHRRLEPFWDHRIADALLGLAREPLKPDARGDLLDTLLEHRSHGAMDFALAQIRLPVPRDESKRRQMHHACVGVFRYALADGWSKIHRVLKADPVFGREIVKEVANGAFGRSKPATAALAPKDVVAFLAWLDQEQARIANPPAMRTAELGPRENAAELRRSVIEELARRGTRESLDALRDAEQALPGGSRLRWAVLSRIPHALAESSDRHPRRAPRARARRVRAAHLRRRWVT